MTPTSRWLQTCSDVMPPLPGPAGTAERLLLLIHFGVNWDGWIGGYRTTYWSRLLPDRVFVATYRNDSLRQWWCDVATALESRPRTADERAELEALLRDDPQPVLELLRDETEALLLRTRIVADTVRRSKPAKETSPECTPSTGSCSSPH